MIAELENRMVVDSSWRRLWLPPEREEKTNKCSGYEEFGTGVFVQKKDAYDYAMERISHGTEQEKQEFVEWFYSGNWIKEGQDG